jgi:hypothetical protein
VLAAVAAPVNSIRLPAETPTPAVPARVTGASKRTASAAERFAPERVVGPVKRRLPDGARSVVATVTPELPVRLNSPGVFAVKVPPERSRAPAVEERPVTVGPNCDGPETRRPSVVARKTSEPAAVATVRPPAGRPTSPTETGRIARAVKRLPAALSSMKTVPSESSAMESAAKPTTEAVSNPKTPVAVEPSPRARSAALASRVSREPWSGRRCWRS